MNIEEILCMETLNQKEQEDYYDHPYGQLKLHTDKQRIWLDVKNSQILIENYVDGFGWAIDKTYPFNKGSV